MRRDERPIAPASRARASTRTPLMRRTQFMLLPRMEFWLRDDVLRFFVPVYLVGLMSAMAIASTIGLAPGAAGLLGATLPFLAVGLFERAVRKATVSRRQLAPAPVRSRH